MMLLYGLFVFGIIFLFNDIFNFETNLFEGIVMLLGFILFLFGFIFSFWQLLRTKPLLTISESKIIIYSIFKEPVILKFQEIESFFTTSQYTRGFPSNRQICIIMKGAAPSKRKFWTYKLLKKIDEDIANSKYAIQTDILNVNHNKLIEILHNRINNKFISPQSPQSPQ